MARIGHRQYSCGFTLLELMVVLVIMAGVYAIVMPAISKALPNTELRSATRQVAAGLRKARSHAVSRKVEARMSLNVETRKFEVTGDTRHYQLPEALNLDLLTVKSEQLSDIEGSIRFYPDGSSTGGRIALSSSNREYHVNVEWLTGQVNVSEKQTSESLMF